MEYADRQGLVSSWTRCTPCSYGPLDCFAHQASRIRPRTPLYYSALVPVLVIKPDTQFHNCQMATSLHVHIFM